MIGLLRFVLTVLASPFKSKLRLEAENAVLRHQLMLSRRRLHGRVRLTNHDRWFFSQLYRWFPSTVQVLAIIQPEKLVRWHRAGFRCLCLPQIKSEHIGGAVRPGSRDRECVRLSRRRVISARLCATTSECACRCNSSCTRAARDADGVR